jgi:hypothetical protein
MQKALSGALFVCLFGEVAPRLAPRLAARQRRTAPCLTALAAARDESNQAQPGQQHHVRAWLGGRRDGGLAQSATTRRCHSNRAWTIGCSDLAESTRNRGRGTVGRGVLVADQGGIERTRACIAWRGSDQIRLGKMKFGLRLGSATSSGEGQTNDDSVFVHGISLVSAVDSPQRRRVVNSAQVLCLKRIRLRQCVQTTSRIQGVRHSRRIRRTRTTKTTQKGFTDAAS